MKQHRDTRQRKLILDAVRRHTDHPSADQIFIEVRSTDSKISRGTVYRNLNYLADAGEITHVRVPGADRYEIRTDFHYHLYCTGCGTVRNVPLEYHHGMLPKLPDTQYSGTGQCLRGFAPNARSVSGGSPRPKRRSTIYNCCSLKQLNKLRFRAQTY